MKVLKPRLRKSKPARVHVGKAIAMRGWKLPCKWVLTARRGFGDAYQKMNLVRHSLDDARATAQELIEKSWDSVEYREVELLTPLRKS